MEKLKEIWLMPIHLIVAVMDVFKSNRDQFKKIKERRVVAGLLKAGALITVVIWLILAILAGDQEKKRLSESVKQLWSETPERPADRLPEQRQSNVEPDVLQPKD